MLNGMLWIEAHGRALGGSAGALRFCGNCVEPVLPLAQGRRIRPDAAAPACAGRCPRRPGLGSPLCGLRCGARPPALCRGMPVRRHRGGECTVENVGQALGRSQGGFSTELHLRAEGGRKPIAAVMTAGERHEQFALHAFMDKGAVPRRGRGCPRLRPRRTAGDGGYSSPPARCRRRQRRIGPVIPTRKDQPRQPDFDKTTYRERNRLERLINRKAVSPHRDPLREAGCQLPRHGHARHDHALVHMSLQRRLSRRLIAAV